MASGPRSSSSPGTTGTTVALSPPRQADSDESFAKDEAIATDYAAAATRREVLATTVTGAMAGPGT